MMDRIQADSARRFAIVARWTVDGTGRPPQADTAVVVDGTRIEDVVSPASTLDSSPDLPVYRFPDATLLPGLIDSHVHLTLDPHYKDLIQYHLERTDDLLLLQASQNARRALMAGVTTVRDLGGRSRVTFAIKEAIEAGIVPGPHVLLAGQPLTCPRGHCYFMGGEVATPAHITRLIDRQADQGADVVKVMATGGGLTPGTGLMRAQFQRDDLALIATESHRRRLPAAAHVGWAPVIRDCAEVGIDTIEHCMFITPTGLFIDESVLDAVQRANPFIVPTRYQFYLRRNDAETFGSLKLEVTRSFPEMYADSMAQLRRFREAGLRLASGSDAGIIGMEFDGVIGEMEVLVLAGYTPLEALCTGTSNAAEALHVGHDRGTIARGRRADLLLVNGAVHDDLSALRSPIVVIKDGRAVRDQGGDHSSQ